MNVLSLFNGMGTLRQAMHDLNIKVDKYYSSEIKPYAIELQQHHFPDVIQVGDITKWKQWDIDWKTIDFIGSGSPCQDLSIAGKRAGINGNKSSLFWVFIEILELVKQLNPNVLFLQENVGSANKLDVGIMSRSLGLYPCNINSSLVTAQLRDRYYWTNIKTYETMFDVVTDIPQPKDKGILFQSILTSGIAKTQKSHCILEGYYTKAYNPEKNQKGLIGRYEMGMQSIKFENGKGLLLNKIELCRLQGFPDNYCDILTRNKAGSLLGDGWTLPVIKHILNFMDVSK
jgi:site-specific DNA-cytosine methylase